MRWASRFLLLTILMLFVSSCASPFYCTHRWSEPGREEFIRYNQLAGESPLVQDVKRLQQQCNASKAKYDL